MARKKIQSATDQRPFIMVYQDFLESDLLDDYFQKLVYIYLKKFADSNNQCFPSIKKISSLTKIGTTKVKQTLAELEEKGVISKANRNRSDGGKTSNLYTLYDFAEIWKVGSSEDVAAVQEEVTEAKMIATLRAKGYIVTKEKEPDTRSHFPQWLRRCSIPRAFITRNSAKAPRTEESIEYDAYHSQKSTVENPEGKPRVRKSNQRSIFSVCSLSDNKLDILPMRFFFESIFIFLAMY